jgi:hypothetical protein
LLTGARDVMMGSASRLTASSRLEWLCRADLEGGHDATPCNDDDIAAEDAII